MGFSLSIFFSCLSLGHIYILCVLCCAFLQALLIYSTYLLIKKKKNSVLAGSTLARGMIDKLVLEGIKETKFLY